jgi:hypothetical protein
VLAVLLLLVVVASFFVEEPLRRSMEARVNAALDGYSVRIKAIHLHPLRFAIDLVDTDVVQQAHPKPPVASLPRLEASVHWRALLHGQLVADFLFDSPKIFLNLTQARAEANDKKPLADRGWQQAAKEIYPLDINLLRLRNGEVTYNDGSAFGPIHVTELTFVARNIRNVTSAAGVYPSPVHLSGRVFDAGWMRFDGSADFFLTPSVGLAGGFELDGMPVKPLTPIARQYAVEVTSGNLSTWGELQISPKETSVAVRDLTVSSLRANFVYAGAAAARGTEVVKEAARGATEPKAAPQAAVDVDRLRLTKAEIGYIDREASPNYRLFASGLDLEVKGFSNRKGAKQGGFDASGRFMNSGRMTLRGSFQPRDQRADFRAALEIREADLRTLNDLLRATGGFDVNAGSFDLYTELAVTQGHLDGYVKPMFRDIEVYNHEQDKNKSVFRQAYEGLIGGLSLIFENHSRDEVATRTDLSGRIDDPQTSTWEIVLNVIKNAFFQAILPGLERGHDTAPVKNTAPANR